MTKLKYQQSGFTLIELLVVVAIIGLLSSVVLSSLNSARTKAADAAVKAQLSLMRSSTALDYDTYGYSNTCDSNSNPGIQFRAAYENSIKGDSSAVCLASNTVAFMAIGNGLVAQTKPATPDKWAASVRLKNGNFFCVDYAGIALERADRGIDNSPLDVDCGAQ